MALFGERTSVSPRLPSPWQAALAQPSPAISVISRTDVLRTPSQLSLSTTGSDHEDPSLIDETTRLMQPASVPSSLASSSAFHRLRSSGISEDLILSPTPGYTSSASVSLSTSTSASAMLEDVRQGVSGGLAGQGYEGVKLVAERDKVGHIEYKVGSPCRDYPSDVTPQQLMPRQLRLLPPNAERFERLTTQLKWRLQEGGGQAVYEIGVLDDGTLIGITDADMDRSLQTLELMAAELGATVMVLRTITLACPPPFPRALCGYEAGAEGNDDEAEAGMESFGGNGTERVAPRAKKKKSPRPPKPKQKPSVFTASDVDNDDASHPAVYKPTGHGTFFQHDTRDPGLISDHQQRARQKSQAKMARRRLSSGFPVEELSAKQRKAWGIGRKGQSIWDNYDSDASVEQGDGLIPLGADSARVEADAISAMPASQSLPFEADNAPVAESWRARNMERASQQDPERWRYKPAMTMSERDQVKQSRKANKDHRYLGRHRPADEGGFSGLFGLDESGGERPVSRELQSDHSDGEQERLARLRTDPDADDGEEMFLFDHLSSSETPPRELTHAAVAALDTKSCQQRLEARGWKQGFHPTGNRPEHPLGVRPNTREPTIKQAKKRRVRVQRAEQRRLDLLRGDGITADGIPLSFDPDNVIGATSVMEAELNEDPLGTGEADPNVLQIVRRLVGEGGHDIDDGTRGDTAGMAAFASTSPSYTIKPSSPSAHRMFSLPAPLPQTSQAVSSAPRDDEPDHTPPSPSDTIVMPLDSLSLSFSQAEVYTAVSPFGSPRSNAYHSTKPLTKDDETLGADHGSPNVNAEQAETSSSGLNLNLAGARVCVEALIVKKMDMDDRYLDFSDFIL